MKHPHVKKIAFILLLIISVSLITIKLLNTFNIPVFPNSYCSQYGFDISTPITPNSTFKCPLGCVVKNPDYSNCPPDAFCGLEVSTCNGW